MFKILLVGLLGWSSSLWASPGKILFVLSAQSELKLQDGKSYKTGFYLNELVLPAMALSEKGYKLEFATPGGVPPHMDPHSEKQTHFKDNKEFSRAKRYLEDLKLTHSSKSPVISLKEALKRAQKYQGIFVPGGHAPMEDLAFSSDLGFLLKLFHKLRRPIALLCHGPVALFSTLNNPRGVIFQNHPVESGWIYEKYKFTVFSDVEEKSAEQGQLGGEVTYYPEESARKMGLEVSVGPKWKAHVVRDRNLLTGQNPASTRRLIREFMSLLKN